MKTNIILSTAITLVLLLGGCGGSNGTDGSGEIGNTDLETPKKPVVVVSDPVEPTAPKLPVDPYKTAGWYGKTKVSLNANGKVYTHSTAGIFGELVQSEEGKDQHDIASYGTATFEVVFPQTEWEDDNGNYFSNYQHYVEGTSEKKSWLFQLKAAGTSYFPITINLDGVYDVKYKEENGTVRYKESSEVNQTIINALHLVDVDNSTEYTVAELETANLTMDGLATRTFRWVLGTTDDSDYAPLNIASARMATFSAEDESSTFTSKTIQNTGGKFGLPPQ